MSRLGTPRGARMASWEALGSTVVLRLAAPGGGAPVACDALDAGRRVVERELDAIDRACSRFRDDSELSRANAAAGRRVSVGPLLLEALRIALRAAELTGGAVDPCLGSALELAGYDRDWSLLEQAPDDRAWQAAAPAGARQPLRLVRARRRRGWRAVELDRASGTLLVPAGLRLDLGATAKAWAADRAAAAASAATGLGALVALGGDVATHGPAPAAGWRIHVTDDHRTGPDAPGQTVAIRDGGLATSSTSVRRWLHRGTAMHHIIDPATARPSRGVWRTASVAAADCTDANIASTAAILLSADAPAWLREVGLPARLLAHDGGTLAVGAWPTAGAATSAVLGAQAA